MRQNLFLTTAKKIRDGLGVGRDDRYILYQKYFQNFVFIHINKCGGTSIQRALGIPFTIHDTAKERRARIGENRWKEKFTFCTIRHPYDKVASHYSYRVKTNQTGLGDRHLTLNQWVERCYIEKDTAYLDNPLMFGPCMNWISDDSGSIIVQEVIKLEELSEKWHIVQKNTGITAEVGRHNESDKSLRRSEKLSDRSKKAIFEHFRIDFEKFGYDPDC
ncbi:sulfotransferase family 2 domain-containing protein [Psychromarinibacter sp. C21-152]|uniref:Sulfotransferase family 2 domain-containing protein n=1 Tax=Psychromarinibacter sediminicola TaxID=3033385 RepID=A0AAE3TCE2_9RHOB|nr:sulfotransferase family 2 domain-containing protein [Psychromarinibacter sediminicola]MDF0603879.1 sulfotransferase family 2 domain-containing protein [Psychromarinibacter sediminicola]